MAGKKQKNELKTGSLSIRAISAPDEQGWFECWEITLKKTGDVIGTARLTLKADQTAELYVEIGSAYQRKGYGEEAADSLADMAFADDRVDFIEVEAEPENKAARHLLEKLEFMPDGGNRFFLQQKAAGMTMVWMPVGLAIGLALGTARGNGSVGMLLGLGVGILFGSLLDSINKKAAAKKLEERKARKASGNGEG